MKIHAILFGILSCLLAAAVGCSQAAIPNDIPRLEKRGGTVQMMVDGKPFLMLSGELGNSSSSSVAYMKNVWPILSRRNFNTILASVTWELIEPQEGQFDFSTLDGVIEDAKKSDLKLVLLWFASWKNGESSYMPMWVKQDPGRFPAAQDKNGKKLPILSTFSDNTRDADAKAFAALMRHLREFDKDHTVLMIQVENEVGILRDTRDHLPAANNAFNGPVPKELMDYLVSHQATLSPDLKEVWQANGSKTSGTWEEIFGPGKPNDIDIPAMTTSPPMEKNEHDNAWRKVYWASDEFFMAWNYARYVNTIAAAGKKQYDIPMYCNAWLQQPDFAWPGTYPCGGPVGQVLNIWQAGAPALDTLSPDLYITTHFDEVVKRYLHVGIPLFIPETANDARCALSAFLDYNAIGFSPFAVDRNLVPGVGPTSNPTTLPATNPVVPPNEALAQTYNVLNFLMPEILECQTKGTLLRLPPIEADATENHQEVKLGNYTLDIRYGGGGVIGGRTFRRPDSSAAAPSAQPQMQPPPPTTQSLTAGFPSNYFPGAFVLMPRPDEYIIGGANLSVTFKSNTAAAPDPKLGYFEESLYVDGHWYKGRRLNGDQTRDNTRWPQTAPGFGIYRIAVLEGN
ncbi:MAG TPA: DUF5597 domain-containing protein [Tepidisphaeraceae bacterium]|nr:DUF5597 domain-containing protein [Tepidisphaeraceae bacterium]